MRNQTITLLFLAVSTLYQAQNGNVGINTSTPTATLDINGGMRVREIPELDITKLQPGSPIESEFIPLYWDATTGEVITKKSEKPYISNVLKYVDNTAPIVLNLDPNQYYVNITEISISQPDSFSATDKTRYIPGFKNTSKGRYPVINYQLVPQGNHYEFSAYFVNTAGGKMYYYDTVDSKIISPADKNLEAPNWRVTYLAVDKRYFDQEYNITINYPGRIRSVSLENIFTDPNSSTTQTINAN